MRRIGDDAVAVLTAGMGVGDDTSNTSEIQVLNRRTGDSCFQTQVSYRSYSDQSLVAISGDGHSITIATGTQVELKQLPQTCR